MLCYIVLTTHIQRVGNTKQDWEVEDVTREALAVLCWIPALLAVLFSLITMQTEDWRFYNLTVLFAIVQFAMAAYTLSVK